jgi:hypothetical protein
MLAGHDRGLGALRWGSKIFMIGLAMQARHLSSRQRPTRDQLLLDDGVEHDARCPGSTSFSTRVSCFSVRTSGCTCSMGAPARTAPPPPWPWWSASRRCIRDQVQMEVAGQRAGHLRKRPEFTHAKAGRGSAASGRRSVNSAAHRKPRRDGQSASVTLRKDSSGRLPRHTRPCTGYAPRRPPQLMKQSIAIAAYFGASGGRAEGRLGLGWPCPRGGQPVCNRGTTNDLRNARSKSRNNNLEDLIS